MRILTTSSKFRDQSMAKCICGLYHRTGVAGCLCRLPQLPRGGTRPGSGVDLVTYGRTACPAEFCVRIPPSLEHDAGRTLCRRRPKYVPATELRRTRLRDLGGKLHRVESMTGGVAREASRQRRSSAGRVPRDQPATVSSRYAQICSTTRRRFPDRLNSQPGALHISFHWTEGPVL